MSNLNSIIQQKDSANIVTKDSNKPFLELKKVVDSSESFTNKKKSNNSVTLVPVVSSPLITNLSNVTLVQDSVVFELSNIKNIPTRKIEKQSTSPINQHTKITFEPSLRIMPDKSWPSIVLIFTLLLLAFTKAFGSSRMRQIYKSVFSFYSAHEVVREEKVFFHQVNFILFLIFLLNISLLLYFVATLFNPLLNTLISYTIILGIVIITYSIKFLFAHVVAHFFEFSQQVPAYTYNVLLYNYILGVLLIPYLAFIYFSRFDNIMVLNFVVLPTIFIVLLIRFVRFFAIGISYNISLFYIILYICTLEILPLVVLGKFFILY